MPAPAPQITYSSANPASSNSTATSLKTISGSSGQPPYTMSSTYGVSAFANSNTAFVPANTYDPAAQLESLNPVKRAQLINTSPSGVQTAFVNSGSTHGGMPTGGPEENPIGYPVQIRGNVAVHQIGRASVGEVGQDLGPAYGTGADHSEHCRKVTRKREYQGTCFCRPVQS